MEVEATSDQIKQGEEMEEVLCLVDKPWSPREISTGGHGLELFDSPVSSRCQCGRVCLCRIRSLVATL